MEHIAEMTLVLISHGSLAQHQKNMTHFTGWMKRYKSCLNIADVKTHGSVLEVYFFPTDEPKIEDKIIKPAPPESELENL